MGYASYTVTRNGEKIDAGYSIEDVCNENGCNEQIDRGLAHLCGETPGGDEWGCGGYFCGGHLYISPREGEPEMCLRCIQSADEVAEKDAPTTSR